MHVFHDRVPIRIVSQRARGANEPFAPLSRRLDRFDLDLNGLPFGYAQSSSSSMNLPRTVPCTVFVIR